MEIAQERSIDLDIPEGFPQLNIESRPNKPFLEETNMTQLRTMRTWVDLTTYTLL